VSKFHCRFGCIKPTLYKKNLIAELLNNCYKPPLDQFEFVIDYKNKQLHSSFFLCECLKVKNKYQQTVIDHLAGLKHLIVNLNEKYFY